MYLIDNNLPHLPRFLLNLSIQDIQCINEMTTFVRDSKFRNIEIKLEKREKFYEQLRVSSNALDGNASICCNSKFIAYNDSSGGSSTIAVLPLSSTGKNHIPISSPAYQQPLIRAHSQAVQDFKFDNFNRHLLYSCATDGHLKLWEIPSAGYIVDCTNPIKTLSSTKGSPLRGISVHPSASGIVAARGSRDIFVFSSETSNEIFSSGEVFTGDLQSLSWSYDGKLLVTTSKDKYIRLFDLRQTGSSVIATVQGHTGIRSTSSTWLGDSPYLVTVGHSSSLDRELLIWDHRNMSEFVKRERIDGSTSALIPLFDSDLNLLLLAGKGDTTVRLYEQGACSSDLFPIANTPVGDLIRGAALLPKQSLDVMSCEVLRLLKLTENAIQPVSFIVPRKEKTKFHEDLYPPTSWEVSPSLTSDEWKSGSDAIPKREPLKPLGGSDIEIAVATIADEILIDSEMVSQDDDAVIEQSSSPSKIASKFASVLKYRHMYGTEYPKASTFFNLTPQLASADSPLIACSDKYWAIPYQGGGGPVYVSLLSKYGKVEPTCPLINGHKSSVLDISFSPFHSNIMATGSTDSTVKIWSLPDLEDQVSMSPLFESDAIASFSTHRNSVRTCNFHPTVEGLVVTSSLDMTVRLHDIHAGVEVSCTELEGVAEGGQVNSVSFNYDGSLLSLACKDRVVRIMDPRANKITLSTPTNSILGRNLGACWCYNGPSNSSIVTVSSSSSGLRQMNLWDPRMMNQSLQTISIDNASGQLFPIFDEDSQVVYLAGKGDTIIRYYELFHPENSNPNIMKANEFQTSKDPIAGICMLPKRTCNVKNVEVSKFLKLTTDAVIPISFVVPRADSLKQYFQDDIFSPTRSKTTSVSIEEWKTLEILPSPSYESLKPDDMMNVSEKPVEEDSTSAKRPQVFKAEIDKQEAENKQRDETFTRLQNLAIQRSKFHPNASNSVKIKAEAKLVNENANEVEDDEWDD